MSVSEIFRRISAKLDEAAIAYMLTGSFASAYYGTPRSTRDLDMVIQADRDQLRRLVDLLPKGEYYVDIAAALEASSNESMFNVIDMATGWKIDFIICKSRPFSQEEFRRRVQVELHGTRLFVTSPEDIVLAKLEWAKYSGSQRQLEDVAAILKARKQSLDQLYIAKWAQQLGVTSEWSEAGRIAELID